MLPRLEAGRHPDTDPTFWDGYVEKPPPSIPSVLASVGATRPWWPSRVMTPRIRMFASAVAVVLILALPGFLLRLIRKGRGKPSVRPSEL